MKFKQYISQTRFEKKIIFVILPLKLEINRLVFKRNYISRTLKLKYRFSQKQFLFTVYKKS